MIGWLQGYILDKEQPGKFVINVHGVGYDVETSLNTFFTLENNSDVITLFIHTVVREDAFLLYGFAEKIERALFRALIKVNGIGPKVAMGILSNTSPAEFIHNIKQQNSAFLSKLPGIGKKTAERLVIEMKDSINNLAISNDCPLKMVEARYGHQEEAIRALEALGYKLQEATKVINKIDDGQKNSEQLIRQALQELAKR